MIQSIHSILSWVHRWGSWLLIALIGVLASILYLVWPKRVIPAQDGHIRDLRLAIEDEIAKKEWEAKKQADANTVKIVENAAKERTEATQDIEHDTNTVRDDGEAVNEYLKTIGAGQR